MLDRSPPAILKEIILVDDYSDHNIHFSIAEYMEKNLPDKVKLFRTDRREGLIRARIFGSRKASGEVRTEYEFINNMLCLII